MVQKKTRRLAYHLTVFSDDGQEERIRRKTLGAGFYRDKLAALMATADEHLSNVAVPRLKELCKKGPARIDICKEVTELMTSVFYRCAVGHDISSNQIEYWDRG